jgi:hypothetical protein
LYGDFRVAKLLAATMQLDSYPQLGGVQSVTLERKENKGSMAHFCFSLHDCSSSQLRLTQLRSVRLSIAPKAPWYGRLPRTFSVSTSCALHSTDDVRRSCWSIASNALLATVLSGALVVGGSMRIPFDCSQLSIHLITNQRVLVQWGPVRINVFLPLFRAWQYLDFPTI